MPTTPWPKDVDFSRLAAETPGSRRDGRSGIWKTTLFDWQKIKASNPKTCYEVFDQAVQRNGDKPFYSTRPLLSPANPSTTPPTPAVYSPTLHWQSYNQIGERRLAIGRGLMVLHRAGALGTPELIDNSGWGVGIWSPNRPEWQIVDLATQAFSLVSVALYDTLGPDVVEYVVNHAPVCIVFATRDHIPAILALAAAGKIPTLKIIVGIDLIPETAGGVNTDPSMGGPAEKKLFKEWGASVGVDVLAFGDVELLGRTTGKDIKVVPPKPEQICTISYTSGTTGMPKGVLLTHGQFTSGIVMQSYGSSFATTDGSPVILLSHLPLAHIYERFLELLIPLIDGCVSFTTGDPLRLLEDAQIIKPTILCTVPRVLNRIHQAIMAQVHAGGLKGSLLKRAIDTKVERFKVDGVFVHPIYDRLVFAKIRALLGGRVSYISSGSAPLSPEVNDVLRACFCCEMTQGYGMTETIGTCSKGIGFDKKSSGTVGTIIVGNELQLEDVKEMGYTSADKPNPRGELLIRGDHVFKGYHKDPENTRKTIDPDGFMHTGDVAEIDAAGRLKIIDRVKNVLKLSQGEYVALEKIEGVYSVSPLLATLMIYGDSLQSYIVVIGIMDPIVASNIISKITGQTISPTDIKALNKELHSKKVNKEILRQLNLVAEKAKLRGFERAKAAYLTVDPFPSHVLTPTLKVKRPVAAKHYKKQIDAMYAGDSGSSEQAEKAKL